MHGCSDRLVVLITGPFPVAGGGLGLPRRKRTGVGGAAPLLHCTALYCSAVWGFGRGGCRVRLQAAERNLFRWHTVLRVPYFSRTLWVIELDVWKQEVSTQTRPACMLEKVRLSALHTHAKGVSARLHANPKRRKGITSLKTRKY
ncbi:unnamed protein product [Pylaiella littoralis]